MNIDIKELKKAFYNQKNRARSRIDKNGNPIEWDLSFNEWLDIWQQSGKLHLRGRRKDSYCMSRKNDIGSYSIDNVEIKPFIENVSEGQIGKYIPNRVGKKNPNARSIMLDGKIFNTIGEAADYFGLTREGLRYRIKVGYYA